MIEHRGRRTSTPLRYDGAVDVWAAGILAYELMLGGPPFEADTKEETCHKILHDRPRLAQMWSTEAKDFLTKASNSASSLIMSSEHVCIEARPGFEITLVLPHSSTLK